MTAATSDSFDTADGRTYSDVTAATPGQRALQAGEIVYLYHWRFASGEEFGLYRHAEDAETMAAKRAGEGLSEVLSMAVLDRPQPQGATPGQPDDVPESVLRDRHVGSEFTRWRQAQVYTDPTGILAEAFAAGFTAAEETVTAAWQPRPAPTRADLETAMRALAATYASVTEHDEIDGHTPGSLYMALRTEVLHDVAAEIRRQLDADPNHEPGLSECGCRNCDPQRHGISPP